MIDWLLVLTLLSVGAVLACFRFIGCAQILGLEDWKNPPPPPDYGKLINNDSTMVAYWRLGEPANTMPGDSAADERNAHNGTYQNVVLPAGGQSAAAAGVLLPGQPGLVATAPTQTSVNVDGGYVKVDFNPDLALNPAADKSFSVEAWAVPEWSGMETDVFRCVVGSREDTGTARHGYVLYAGPILDPTTYATTDPTMHWQAWVGDGIKNNWLMLVGPPVAVGQTTYLLLTYDGMSQTLTLDAIIDPSGETSPPPRLSMPATYSPNPGKPLYIGMGATEIPVPPGQPMFPFRGRLQEIAFYGVALTSADVSKHLKEAVGA